VDKNERFAHGAPPFAGPMVGFKTMRLSMQVVAVWCAASSAAAYTVSGNSWPKGDGPVEYYVSSAGAADIPDDSEITAVQNAFRSWECVLCSTVQFRYMGTNPAATLDQDGLNTVLWVQDAALLQQLVGASDTFLSVAINYDPAINPFFEQDILLNDTTFMGQDIVWSTNPPPPDMNGFAAYDVETVVLREVGLFLGLKDNCDMAGMNCQPLSNTVLTNTYGGINRTLRQDDQDGVCAVYPGTKPSCDLQRLRDSCERDCDCDPGLVCVPDGVGTRMCSKTCDETGACPNRSGCVLVPGTTNGLCLRNAEGNKKLAGMVCDRDSQCLSNVCSFVSAVGKQVCNQSCATDATCEAGYTCRDNVCLLSNTGDTVPCEQPAQPQPPPKDDGGPCSATQDVRDGLPLFGALLVLLALGRGTRRRTRG